MKSNKTAGIRAARRSRGDHISDVKYQSFLRGGSGGFTPSYTLGSQNPYRLKEGSAIGNIGLAPYSSVISAKKTFKTMQQSTYATYNPSMDSQDVVRGARLLHGQAVKKFLNSVRPKHLTKIERFLKEELIKHPINKSGNAFDHLQRLSVISTAWQALNDCLPQFQGTLEDIREMYDARVDHLRLSLSFLDDIDNLMQEEEEEEEKEKDREKRKNTELPPVAPTITNINVMVPKVLQQQQPPPQQPPPQPQQQQPQQPQQPQTQPRSRRTQNISSSSNNSSATFSSSNEVEAVYKSAWSPVGSTRELKSFWDDVSRFHSKQIKRPGSDFLEHVRCNYLPCLMTCYQELSRHVSERSKVRGKVLEQIWHRAMLLVANICRHAKRMRMHHTKVLEALENTLKIEQNFLKENEQSVNHYNHELCPEELFQQEDLGEKLKDQETQLNMLKERKNALVRARKTLQSLVAEYTKRRHTEMEDAEKNALEAQISNVTFGSLSSAIEKQQDRLRQAELAAVHADLLAKMKQVQSMLETIKDNIRRSVGSSIKRHASIQVDASDQSWTVEVSSSRKIAPSQGWWTLHRKEKKTSNKHKDKNRTNLEQFDLASGMNESKSISLPTMFQSVLTLGAPKTQVRSMAKITFHKTVHAIYDSMLEVWEEGGHNVRRDTDSGSSTAVTMLHGWDTNTTVSDFVYDYLLLQFGIAELSEPKLLQLLATSYRLRKKSLRAKLFALVCGITKPVDLRGRVVHNLHGGYQEDALKFAIGVYSALRTEHGMGRCLEVTKKSLYYAELDIAIYMAKDIFYTETEKDIQTMTDDIKNQQEMIVAEKTMLGLDHRNSNHQKGKKIPVVNVDILLDMWMTKWTIGVANSLNRYKVLFVASDVDEDGRLSYREFSTTLKGLDPDIESHTIAELFRGCIQNTKQGGAEIDCTSFANHMTRNTDYMAPMRWEGRAESKGNVHDESGNTSDSGTNDTNNNFESNTEKSKSASVLKSALKAKSKLKSKPTSENKNENEKEKETSCIQMYGTESSHMYKDVSRSVRLLREDWSRWQGLVKKHLDWILDHAKTPDEKWDSEHCMKRLGHFERLFEHALDGPDNAELAWQAYRLLRHQTETLRQNRTMLAHAMAPLHLISRFKKKMTNVARLKSKLIATKKQDGNDDETATIVVTKESKGESEEKEKVALAFSSVRWHHLDKLNSMLDFNVVDINICNHQGNTLLHTACQNGHLDIARTLCRKNIEINAQNIKGDTAMHFARYYDYDEIFRYLREQGADDALRNLEGETCYEKVASHS